MTGNKGGGGSRSRRREVGAGDAGRGCESVAFQSVVNSPSPEILPVLRVGDCLKVALVMSGTRRVVVVQHQGETVGSITSPEISKLLECLAAGWPFKALVLDVNKGRCEVAVSSGVCN